MSCNVWSHWLTCGFQHRRNMHVLRRFQLWFKKGSWWKKGRESQPTLVKFSALQFFSLLDWMIVWESMQTPFVQKNPVVLQFRWVNHLSTLITLQFIQSIPTQDGKTEQTEVHPWYFRFLSFTCRTINLFLSAISIVEFLMFYLDVAVCRPKQLWNKLEWFIMKAFIYLFDTYNRGQKCWENSWKQDYFSQIGCSCKIPSPLLPHSMLNKKFHPRATLYGGGGVWLKVFTRCLPTFKLNIRVL